MVGLESGDAPASGVLPPVAPPEPPVTIPPPEPPAAARPPVPPVTTPPSEPPGATTPPEPPLTPTPPDPTVAPGPPAAPVLAPPVPGTEPPVPEIVPPGPLPFPSPPTDGAQPASPRTNNPRLAKIRDARVMQLPFRGAAPGCWEFTASTTHATSTPLKTRRTLFLTPVWVPSPLTTYAWVIRHQDRSSLDPRQIRGGNRD